MKKEAVLDSAIKILLENSAASMQEIASAAGIGRATLHRYYPSRDDLINELVLLVFSEAEQRVRECRLHEGEALEALERLIVSFVTMGHRFHFLLDDRNFRLDEKIEAEIKRREKYLDEEIENLFRRGQQEGLLRQDMPLKWLNEVLTAIFIAAWQNIRDGYIAVREAPKLVLTTFLSGLGKT